MMNPEEQLLKLHITQFCAIFEDILVASNAPVLLQDGWLDTTQLFTVLPPHRQDQIRENLPDHLAQFRRYPKDWITRELAFKIGVESESRAIRRASASRMALWYLVEQDVALAP